MSFDWGGLLSGVAKVAVPGFLGYNAIKQQESNQNAQLDFARQQEELNYQNYLRQVGAQGSGGGRSSGGGGNGAAVAAANATEKNRQKALKKANKVEQNTYKELLKMYAPYRQTADQLLPQMSQTYQNSLGLQNSLASYVNSPAQVAKLDAAGPAWNINVPLPDEVRLK